LRAEGVQDGLILQWSKYLKIFAILVNTDSFFDLSGKNNYSFGNSPNIKLSVGIQNVLNSYQQDFYKGLLRDAGYMYGPFKPFTTTFGISIEY